MLEILGRNWWVVLIRGIVAVLFGVVAIIWPDLTLGALLILIGAYFIVDGIFTGVAAVRAIQRGQQWWMLALEAVASVVAGLIAWVWPDLTALALVYVIAAWAIITGIFEIVTAIRLRREITNEFLLIVSGALSVLFGIVIAAFPRSGALSVIWIIGIYAIAFGVLLIALSFRLRGMQPAA
jgi:uncharacterized membrane protein HdeD (DUF308 family)